MSSTEPARPVVRNAARGEGRVARPSRAERRVAAALLVAVATGAPSLPADLWPPPVAPPSTDAAGPVQVPLQIELRARALVPGEPVRVVVRGRVPLESLDGNFFGREVFFVRGDDATWSGWSMIGLEQEPGPAVLEVRGVAGDGSPAVGTLAVTVEPKRFPEEELSVAPRYVTPPREVRGRLAREREKLAEVYSARTSLPAPGAAFLKPVPGPPTSTFGTRRLYNGEPRAPHPGLDLRAAEGTAVRAPAPARVALARDLYYSGNTVILDHGGRLFTIYAHLSKIEVEEGRSVDAGDRLGLSGATGRVTGPHLHWGAKIGDRPFDPVALTDPALF